MRGLVALAALAFLSPALAQAPDKHAADLQRAEQVGLELLQAYDRAPASSAEIDRARNVAESAKLERCSAPYRTVALSPKVVYLLADPSEGVAVGRHFRVEVVGENSVGAVVPSSQTCLLIAERPAAASAGATRPARTFLSHTLTPTPNEFHVFLSLKHDRSIFVATRAGVWKVEAGLIRYLDATPGD